MSLKILFFGLGSIGTRHARLLRENFDFELYAYRTRKEEKLQGVKEFHDLNKAFNLNPDVAFITNPTHLHVDTAIKCAEEGIDLFIEKPLSHNTGKLGKLREIVEEKNLFAYVALCMRFHPVIKKLKELVADYDCIYSRTTATSYLPDWRPDQDYSESYSADKDKGGGILLDLIHELDYNYWLFGEIDSIKGRYGKISNLKTDSEGFAEMNLSFEKEMLGGISLNWFSFNKERKIKVYGNDVYLEGNLENNYVKMNNGEEVKKETFSMNRDFIYKKQLEYFFDCYRKDKKPMNNLEEASKVLNYLISFKNQNQFLES